MLKKIKPIEWLVVQESTSESVNGWYGVYLFGLGIGDQRITDLGRLLMAMEIR